ncbi:hypothetical protein [Shouchella rhizosphaerae]|uniref:Uncharacterized protein n=2 Tax=Shouchella TaxID=2893057 RepID=A0A268NXH4_SHOCL|nr:hypothetical protein [Shouchella rhizosphaerae]PAE83924.1 hypothetical protein CHH77_05840 [Shouchella clausii]PAE88108.1 hypothetical protein CHH72_14765 [Shouchella clausii]PAE94073.1 hypothetical protein CHH70_09810 [Shouchella clausii]PAF11481.1 hypothetical protein CHH65_00420 [Shouchella clausii]SHK95202.1 hypothetical protein SAMN05192535_0307 [Shouchella rhizosphaerae]
MQREDSTLLNLTCDVEQPLFNRGRDAMKRGVVKTDFFGRSIEVLSDDSLTDYQEYFKSTQMAGNNHKF